MPSPAAANGHAGLTAADPRFAFAAAAVLMVVAALGCVLPFLARGAGRCSAVADGATPPARDASRAVLWATRGVLGIGIPLAAFALYALLGDPGALSASRAALSKQMLATPVHDGAALPEAPLYAELERHLRRHPGDARALVLKARLDMQAQRFELAAAAYQRALAAPSKVARDAAVWVEYAEARGMLQGGVLAGQPRQLVEKALALDANNPQALDLAGSAAWEQRDFAAASRYWKRLLEQIAPDDARHAELSAAIERADRSNRLSLPP